MKQLFTLVFLVILYVPSTSIGMTTFQSQTEQSNIKNPLTATKNSSNKSIELILNEVVKGEQAKLIISDEAGNVILDEEVEVMNGQIFKTIPISTLQSLGNGVLNIVLESENMAFKTTISL